MTDNTKLCAISFFTLVPTFREGRRQRLSVWNLRVTISPAPQRYPPGKRPHQGPCNESHGLSEYPSANGVRRHAPGVEHALPRTTSYAASLNQRIESDHRHGRRCRRSVRLRCGWLAPHRLTPKKLVNQLQHDAGTFAAIVATMRRHVRGRPLRQQRSGAGIFRRAGLRAGTTIASKASKNSAPFSRLLCLGPFFSSHPPQLMISPMPPSTRRLSSSTNSAS